MSTTDEDKEVIEEQHDQILRLRRRLTIATCTACIAIAALVGVSFLFALSLNLKPNGLVSARQAALQQQQVAVRQAYVAQQNAVLAQQQAQVEAARLALELAKGNEEPVVAPVP